MHYHSDLLSVVSAFLCLFDLGMHLYQIWVVGAAIVAGIVVLIFGLVR